ncbi:MAG TPA: arginase [Bacillota bacterium]|nr:arginase [Bacillota bacterium]
MSKQTISLIGVPVDLGQSRRGVDMGPSAIRYAHVKDVIKELGYPIIDLGDLTVSNDLDINEASNSNLHNLYQIVYENKKLANIVNREVAENHFPLILGGDHSISIGSIAGIAKHYRNLGVIWYDAHGDLNTDETSPSGNIHGMSLAANLGFGAQQLTTILDYTPKIKPENIVIIGARSLDPGEKELIRRENIKVFTMQEIDRLGMPKVMEETIAYLKERTDGVHLSLDLDALDPTEVPGVGTPVIGGLTYRESHLAMEMLAEVNIVTSAEFVEVNPILDVKNKTAEVAVELIGSLLGKNLL